MPILTPSSNVLLIYAFVFYFSCLLVSKDSKDQLSEEEILYYFENLSGWKPIKIERIRDGILLVYDSRKSKYTLTSMIMTQRL